MKTNKSKLRKYKLTDQEKAEAYICQIFDMLQEAYENDTFDVRMFDICEKAMIYKLIDEPMIKKDQDK